MIAYSTTSQRAVARLMRPYNDIHIYVEDAQLCGVYVRLINRAIKGLGKITKVIPLGDRENVVRAAANDNNGKRSTLYIVDGDLDLIAHKSLPSSNNLYRLGVYSIENVLFEKHALEKLAQFSAPAMTPEAAIERLDYEGLCNELDNVLSLYFFALAIARRLKLRAGIFSIQAQAISIERNGKIHSADTFKCNQRIAEMIRSMKEAAGLQRYRAAKLSVRRNIISKKSTGVHYVSAKKFHLLYVNGRLSGPGCISLNSTSAASYLVDHCNFERDPRLRRRLRRVARQALNVKLG